MCLFQKGHTTVAPLITNLRSSYLIAQQKTILTKKQLHYEGLSSVV